jgi:PAS domain-containing protein
MKKECPSYEKLARRISKLEVENRALRNSADAGLRAPGRQWGSGETAERAWIDYDAILRHIPEIIYRVDPEGRITFINEAIRQYGYEPEELLDTHYLSLVHPEDRVKAVYRMNERRTGDRSTRAFEVRLMPKARAADSAAELAPEEKIFLLDAEGVYSGATS